MVGDGTSMGFEPIRFSGSMGLSKIRLPGTIVEALRWPSVVEEIECFGVFTKLGELVCYPPPSDIPSETLARAIKHRDDWLANTDPNDDRIAAAAFITNHRVFPFRAKWQKSSNQMDLRLGSIPLFFLGWKDRDATTPIFPAVFGKTLVLYSQARVELLLDSPLL